MACRMSCWRRWRPRGRSSRAGSPRFRTRSCTASPDGWWTPATTWRWPTRSARWRSMRICARGSVGRDARASCATSRCPTAPIGCVMFSRPRMSRGWFAADTSVGPDRTAVVRADARVRTDDARPRGSIAYVLKGYPRLSELFIASEIRRLERLGLRLRLYVIKQSDEAVRHTIVSEIDAKPEYLPPAGSVSSMPLWRWLVQNLPRFAPSLRRMLSRAPHRVMRAAALAAVEAIRARRGLRPRKVYVKEWLQAVALADRLLDAPDVTHLHAHFCHGATTVTWLVSVMTGLPFSFTAHAKDL